MSSQDAWIHEAARLLLRRAYGDESVSEGRVRVPVDVEWIARDVLGLTLLRAEEIREDPRAEDLETAGRLDRTLKQVEIAERFPLESQRFTLAHELGHWLLHKDIFLHRDRPAYPGGGIGLGRPHKEREADLFAAEILMPSETLARAYSDRFPRALNAYNMDEDLAFRLSIEPLKWSQMSLASRAHAIAVVPIHFPQPLEPLSKAFAVSATAMAIQLQEVGLVS